MVWPMVRPTPLRLCRRIAPALGAAIAAAVMPVSAAQAAPWNTAAFTAWQFADAAKEYAGKNCGPAVARAEREQQPVSALDRIRMQQAGLADGNVAVSHRRPAYMPAVAMRAPPVTMEPAAAGIGCAPLAPAARWMAPVAPKRTAGRQLQDFGGQDFLASTIVPIRRTAFDAQWARVSARGAGQANVRAAMMSAGEGASRREQVAAVNRWVNGRVRFTEDTVNYGQRDYWADAAETLRRGAGDCEDYAIAKMQILAAIGIAREDMFLTLARDNIRRADHAVLVVKLDGQPLVLDNGSDALLDGSVANDFRPVYSFSGDRRYLHGF